MTTTKTNLTAAHEMWANAPAEARFWTTAELRSRAQVDRDASEERETRLLCSEISTPWTGRGILWDGAEVSHHAFGQLARIAGAPAGYLRSLSAPTAAAALSEGLLGIQGKHKVLLGEDGRTLSAVTSTSYSRLWDDEWIGAIQQLEDCGWRVPPARKPALAGVDTRTATERDVIEWGHESPLTVKVGDQIAPSGLYRTERESFAFLVQPEVRIDDGSEGGLMRGAFFWNSEVGARSMGATTFLLRVVCGNHIVWGASEVATTRHRHVGDVRGRLYELVAGIRTMDEAASGLESEIRRLQRTRIADAAEEVARVAASATSLTLAESTAALEFAQAWEAVDGDPFSFWGFAQGITRSSQLQQSVTERTRLDAAAGTLLAMA
jgi:hypothetical protein